MRTTHSRESEDPSTLSRRDFLKYGGVAVGGAAATAALAACGASDSDGDGAPATTAAPGTTAPGEPAAIDRDLIVAQPDLWTSLDHLFDRTSQESTANLGGRLFIYDYDGVNPIITDLENTLVGELAEGLEINADKTQYTITLKQGVLSHHGNEMTSEDVVYSYARGVAPDRSFGLDGFLHSIASQITDAEQVKALDDYTVQITLERPFPTFLHHFVLPFTGNIHDSETMRENSTNDDPWSEEWKKNNSEGFGPYMLEDFTQGTEAIWVANPNYVLYDVPIKRVIWRVVPESATRLSLIESGDVHVANAMLVREQVQAQQAGLSLPNAVSSFSQWTWYPLDVPPWSHPLVRRAYTHVIPYDDIIDIVYQGKARREFGPVWEPGGVPYAHTELFERYYRTDPDESRRLLEEAGFPDGVSSELWYNETIPDQEEMCVLIRDTAAEGGWDISIVGKTTAAIQEARIDPLTVGGAGAPANLFKDQIIVPDIFYQVALLPPFGARFCTPDSVIGGASCEVLFDDFTEEQILLYEEGLRNALESGDWDSPAATAGWEQSLRAVADGSPMSFYLWFDPASIHDPRLTGWEYRIENATDYSRLSWTS